MSNYYLEQQKVRNEINNAFKQSHDFKDKLKPKEILVYDLQLAFAVPTKTIREAISICERVYPDVEYHTEESWKTYCEVMGVDE